MYLYISIYILIYVYIHIYTIHILWHCDINRNRCSQAPDLVLSGVFLLRCAAH